MSLNKRKYEPNDTRSDSAATTTASEVKPLRIPISKPVSRLSGYGGTSSSSLAPLSLVSSATSKSALSGPISRPSTSYSIDNKSLSQGNRDLAYEVDAKRHDQSTISNALEDFPQPLPIDLPNDSTVQVMSDVISLELLPSTILQSEISGSISTVSKTVPVSKLGNTITMNGDDSHDPVALSLENYIEIISPIESTKTNLLTDTLAPILMATVVDPIDIMDDTISAQNTMEESNSPLALKKLEQIQPQDDILVDKYHDMIEKIDLEPDKIQLTSTIEDDYIAPTIEVNNIEANGTMNVEEDGDNDEEEEVFVYVTIPMFDKTQFLSKMSTISFDVDSLFSSKPFCKLGGFEFTGQHERSLGTNLFFASDSIPDSANVIPLPDIPATGNSKVFNYASISNQIVTFELTKIPNIKTTYKPRPKLNASSKIQKINRRSRKVESVPKNKIANIDTDPVSSSIDNFQPLPMEETSKGGSSIEKESEPENLPSNLEDIVTPTPKKMRRLKAKTRIPERKATKRVSWSIPLGTSATETSSSYVQKNQMRDSLYTIDDFREGNSLDNALNNDESKDGDSNANEYTEDDLEYQSDMYDDDYYNDDEDDYDNIVLPY